MFFWSLSRIYYTTRVCLHSVPLQLERFCYLLVFAKKLSRVRVIVCVEELGSMTVFSRFVLKTVLPRFVLTFG